MEEYQRKLAGIWKRNNCHPVKSVLPILVQAPVFIGFFTSLQSLARAKVVTHAFISDCNTMSQAWYAVHCVVSATLLIGHLTCVNCSQHDNSPASCTDKHKASTQAASV
jgi:membrane protein insertase Oxa1/YidC/SpoIIIJ